MNDGVECEVCGRFIGVMKFDNHCEFCDRIPRKDVEGLIGILNNDDYYPSEKVKNAWEYLEELLEVK